MRSKFLLFFLVGVLAMSCSRVEPGYVGVKVKTLGQNKGVAPESLGVGRYWMGLYYDLYTYPSHVVIYPFTAGSTEGSETNEAMVFQDKNGVSCDVDVALSAQVDATRAPLVFQTYLKDMLPIVKEYCRQDMNNFFVSYASNYSVEEVYSTEKMNMLKFVLDNMKKKYDPTGIMVMDIAYKSNIRFPENVTAAINAKIGATQLALQKEQEIMQAKAEAQKTIEKARGEFIRDSLQAAANRLLTLNITPLFIEYTLATKWNGVTPVYSGTGSVLPPLFGK